MQGHQKESGVNEEADILCASGLVGMASQEVDDTYVRRMSKPMRLGETLPDLMRQIRERRRRRRESQPSREPSPAQAGPALETASGSHFV